MISRLLKVKTSFSLAEYQEFQNQQSHGKNLRVSYNLINLFLLWYGFSSVFYIDYVLAGLFFYDLVNVNKTLL